MAKHPAFGGPIRPEELNTAAQVARIMDRLDDMAADELDGTAEYADLRDALLDFVDRHPEIASIVRSSGYPV